MTAILIQSEPLVAAPRARVASRLSTMLPVVLLAGIAFGLAGIAVGAAFALVKALLFLPARLLGYRG